MAKSARHYRAFIMAAGLALHAQTSVGQDVPNFKAPGFIQQMQLIRTAQEATVVVVPHHWAFRGRLTEADLREVGCTFSTRDPSRIAALADVVGRANVRVFPSLVFRSLNQDPREGIFMTLSDASEVKFLFGPYFLNEEIVQGMFTHLPEFDKSHITADKSLLRDLELWAAGTGPPTAKAIYNRRFCEYFVREMRG